MHIMVVDSNEYYHLFYYLLWILIENLFLVLFGADNLSSDIVFESRESGESGLKDRAFSGPFRRRGKGLCTRGPCE